MTLDLEFNAGEMTQGWSLRRKPTSELSWPKSLIHHEAKMFPYTSLPLSPIPSDLAFPIDSNRVCLASNVCKYIKFFPLPVLMQHRRVHATAKTDHAFLVPAPWWRTFLKEASLTSP